MSQPSPDAKAVVRAVESLTTQARRIADALETPVVEYADEEVTTPDDACRPVEIDGELIRVHGGRGEMSDESRAALAEVIQAARKFAAEYPEQARAIEDDDPPAACWHTEPDSPCDWDVCRQPERLAAGDRRTDPATNPPLGPKLQQATTQQASSADEDACMTDIAGACDGTTRDCAHRTEGGRRTDRQASLRNLIDRLDRNGALDYREGALLRQHVETEIREADTARTIVEQTEDLLRVAHETSNKSEAARARAVQRAEQAGHERDVAAADLETADRLRDEAQRDRDQHAAVLAEVLGHFTHKGHPGEPCLSSGWVSVKTVEQWRSTLARSEEQPWWRQVAVAEQEAVAATQHVLELKAAIDRVRRLVAGAAQTTAAGISDYDIGRHELARDVLVVLDSTEQPTTEA